MSATQIPATMSWQEKISSIYLRFICNCSFIAWLLCKIIALPFTGIAAATRSFHPYLTCKPCRGSFRKQNSNVSVLPTHNESPQLPPQGSALTVLPSHPLTPDPHPLTSASRPLTPDPRPITLASRPLTPCPRPRPAPDPNKTAARQMDQGEEMAARRRGYNERSAPMPGRDVPLGPVEEDDEHYNAGLEEYNGLRLSMLRALGMWDDGDGEPSSWSGRSDSPSSV